MVGRDGDTAGKKMEGGEKMERRRRKTGSKHVDATAPRNYRAIYWILRKGVRDGGDSSNGR